MLLSPTPSVFVQSPALATLCVMLGFLSATASPMANAAPRVLEADVCIYAATPSGLLAAIASRQRGKSVVIVEPSRWVGGMLGAGLKPRQDCPNINATGGLTRELLHSLGKNGEILTSYGRSGLNPAAIRHDFEKLIHDHNLQIVFDHRIASCQKAHTNIVSVTFDEAPFDELGCPVDKAGVADNLCVIARIYIDASYEGDLMPRAGVSYRTGREASQDFNEQHAGVQPPAELTPISPFVRAEDPSSGLLKWVESDHGKPVGAADEYTQAYNYRCVTTDDPEHRLPITAPDHYNSADFELVGRYVEHLTQVTKDADSLRKKLIGICPGWMNSGEWNYQRESLFSQAPLGVSHIYADGSHADHARIWKMHQNYLRGLYEFMRSDPRVPPWYREEISKLGLDRRAHPETEGWPHQLYIRVARRLKGCTTITAHDVYNRTVIGDPIGLAQYGIDTYPARRIWMHRDGGFVVGIEGKMFIGGSAGPTNVPYPISYRAITPLPQECTNLLVPVCFSATHLGYASARMEPVFMICGESAGIAACLAIDQKTTVQTVNPTSLQEALTQARQKLSWDPRRDTSPASKPETLSFETLLHACDADADASVNRSEWGQGKPGWEWLFDIIDTSRNERIEREEYDAFQVYKRTHPDWLSRRQEAR